MGKMLKHSRVKDFFKEIDARIVFIAVVTTMMAVYYVNPMKNVGVAEWDRTFSSALFAGFSINKRIQHFFLLFLFIIPVVYILSIFGYGILFRIRETYKDIFFNVCAVIFFPVSAAYISRYSPEIVAIGINEIVLLTLASFLIILVEIAILDSGSMFSDCDIYFFCIAYMIAISSINIMLRVQTLKSISITSAIFFVYFFIIIETRGGRKLFPLVQNIICLLMWLPFFICILIEGLYYLNEKGITVVRYYTNVCKMVFVFLVLSILIGVKFREKVNYFISAGYVGAIFSLAALKYFSHAYQYTWSYLDYANTYEMGNMAVAADTLWSGKIPVVDYFSAHALSDVWTRILYCVLHLDDKGILVDPYGWIVHLIALLILFCIVQKLFNRDVAILFVCVFPFSMDTIKGITICFIPIALLLWILKKKNLEIKSYLGFWSLVLVNAFLRYDEGWGLGIACILAYCIIVIVQKKWEYLKLFMATGVCVGSIALVLYFVYCGFNGISAITRLTEWLSVSLGSNSTWATSSFGDASTFEFLLCYFIAPMCAIGILIIIIVQFIKRKTYPALAGITMAFAIAELLFIPRGIKFVNLYVCQGKSSVILNFIHWTVSSFVLYELSIREKTDGRRLLTWMSSFGIVILAEGALVTGVLPTSNAILYAGAAYNSETIKLSNDMSYLRGQERIVYDEQTVAFINQFQQVFDTLLDEDETFLDFANVTSLYMLTGRERPFYVGQSPSLLTDLNSQKCFLDEISQYKVPLAVLGTTDVSYTQQMVGVPHNIRYYTIAEYIYKNYRPLILAGDFAIWCEKEVYESFHDILKENNFDGKGYQFVDYGYDKITCSLREDERTDYRPFHQFGLGMLPYIWANNDDYDAITNSKLVEIYSDILNIYKFEGSQAVDRSKGNYLAFECTNPGTDDISVGILLKDSKNEDRFFEYNFTVVPGNNSYMIRVSQDYFWDVFNIDSIEFFDTSECVLDNVRILEGD